MQEDKGENRKPKRARRVGPAVPVGTPKEGYPQRMDCATGAQLVGVSESTLRKATAKGLVPDDAIVRRGTRVTYDKDGLLRWRTDSGKAA